LTPSTLGRNALCAPAVIAATLGAHYWLDSPPIKFPYALAAASLAPASDDPKIFTSSTDHDTVCAYLLLVASDELISLSFFTRPLSKRHRSLTPSDWQCDQSRELPLGCF